MSGVRSRWAAIGAAVAVSLGAGGLGIANATLSSGSRATFVPITPCRLFDTRPGVDNVGAKSSPLGPDETYTLAVHGNNGQCLGIPTDAVAVSLNVTALNATAGTFLTIYASDADRPLASSLNPAPGAPPTPNGVVSDLSATGFVSVYNANGSVDVLADVVGYYVDHNHDDRYVRLPEHEFVINPATFVEVDPADAWAYAGLWSHNPGVPTNECLYAPLENVPVGRQLGPVRVSYRSTAGSNVQASVIGLRSTPGATAGSIQTLVSPAVSAPATPGGTIGQVVINLTTGVTTVAADFQYAALVCAESQLILSGYTIELT